MKLRNEEIVQDILDIIAEAKKYNYPELNLKIDLDNYIDKKLDEAYDEGYENGYSDAKDEFGTDIDF